MAAQIQTLAPDNRQDPFLNFLGGLSSTLVKRVADEEKQRLADSRLMEQRAYNESVFDKREKARLDEKASDREDMLTDREFDADQRRIDAAENRAAEEGVAIRTENRRVANQKEHLKSQWKNNEKVRKEKRAYEAQLLQAKEDKDEIKAAEDENKAMLSKSAKRVFKLIDDANDKAHDIQMETIKANGKGIGPRLDAFADIITTMEAKYKNTDDGMAKRNLHLAIKNLKKSYTKLATFGSTTPPSKSNLTTEQQAARDKFHKGKGVDNKPVAPVLPEAKPTPTTQPTSSGAFDSNRPPATSLEKDMKAIDAEIVRLKSRRPARGGGNTSTIRKIKELEKDKKRLQQRIASRNK